MKEKTKTTILIIIIILCAIGLTFLSYKILNNEEQKEPVSNPTNIIEDKNEGKDITENKEQKSEESKEENNDKKVETNDVKETKIPQIEGTTNEEKAINIVKNKWGQSNDVYFATMGIDANGKYIISVNDSATSAVKAWCYVDVDKGQIEIK